MYHAIFTVVPKVVKFDPYHLTKKKKNLIAQRKVETIVVLNAAPVTNGSD